MPHSNYKYGDTREDGYVWVGKRYNRGKEKMERTLMTGDIRKLLN